jgi:hypothetical protein
MRWLLHGNLTQAVAAALKRHGHSIQISSDIDLAPDAPAAVVLEAAHTRQLDILTSDAALANAQFESPVKFNRSLVFLQLPGGDTEQDDAIDRLFARYRQLTPGRLYTVTATRVKIRQLPAVR